MNAIKYPRRKVFTAFFFCPLVLGFFAGIYKFITALAHLVSNPKLLGEVRGGELLFIPIAAPIIAQVAFLPPFLGFALVIAWMKVNRTSRNCVLVSLLGGFIAMLWVLLFVMSIVNSVKSAQFSDYFFEMIMIFLTSMATCWLAARFSLPDEKTASLLTE